MPDGGNTARAEPGTAPAAEGAPVEDLTDLAMLPPPGRDLTQIANSIAHQTTHLPNNPHCPICAKAKMFKKHAKASKLPVEERPKAFGDHVTGDHMCEQRKHVWDGGNTALTLLDVGTRYRAIYPRCDKSATEALSALQHFAGPKQAINMLYTGNAQELYKAAKDLVISHDTSTPHVSTTNAIAERNNRSIEEGTRTLLLQSGLHARCWRRQAAASSACPF